MPRNIAENLNRLSTAHERYRQTDDRRQTDGRQQIANVFSKNALVFKGALQMSSVT